MTIGVLVAVAVVVLAGRVPFTWSYVAAPVAWTLLCIMIWWQLWYPGC